MNPERLIPDLLEAHPEVRTVLDDYGLKGCGGINEQQLVVRLNEFLTRRPEAQ